jgi:hypothetical protein
MKTRRSTSVVVWGGACLASAAVMVAPAPVRGETLTTLGVAYTQNFNTLATSGFSSSLPFDWAFNESGSLANATYRADIGTNTTGDTRSLGSSSDADRAFGTLGSGSLTPVIGSKFTNSTGSTIAQLAISYFGEQWRDGDAGARTDRLDFQYSLNATSLTTGTWIDVNTLDFVSPSVSGVGARDGNLPANRTLKSDAITGLSILNGGTFWIRWNEFDTSGAEDALGVDDFFLTPSAAPGAVGVPLPVAAVGGLALFPLVAIRRVLRNQRDATEDASRPR